MPRLADPANTFDVALPADEHLPEETRPVFTFRHMTARQFARFGEIVDRIDAIRQGRDAEATMQSAFNLLLEAASFTLIGWRNMSLAGEPVDFDPERLADLLCIDELEQLIGRVARRSRGMIDETPPEAASQSPSEG